jgi:hypothetical protein
MGQDAKLGISSAGDVRAPGDRGAAVQSMFSGMMLNSVGSDVPQIAEAAGARCTLKF